MQLISSDLASMTSDVDIFYTIQMKKKQTIQLNAVHSWSQELMHPHTCGDGEVMPSIKNNSTQVLARSYSLNLTLHVHINHSMMVTAAPNLSFLAQKC